MLARPSGTIYQIVTTELDGDRRGRAADVFATVGDLYLDAAGERLAVGHLPCALMDRSGDARSIEAAAESRARAVIEATGADLVLWGRARDDGADLDLRFTRPAATSRLRVAAEAGDPRDGLGTHVGGLIAYEITRQFGLTDEEQGGLVLGPALLALDVREAIADDPPPGLDAAALGAVHDAAAVTLARIGGEDGDPAALERAIRHGRRAAELWKDVSPLRAASALATLGAAQSRLAGLTGDAAAAREAVRTLRAAADGTDRGADAEKWATARHNLGGALRDLGEMSGDAGPVREAIPAFEAALEDWTAEDDPADHVLALTGLASSHHQIGSLTGDPAAYDAALATYRRAATPAARQAVPHYWAIATNGIAAVLSRIAGDDAEGLAEVARAYAATLEIWTREDAPTAWATAMSNLANTHLALHRLDPGAGHLDSAIAAFEDASKVRTVRAMPAAHGTAQTNLGIALSRRGAPGDADRAVAAFEAALLVLPEGAAPGRRAGRLENLALAYEGRFSERGEIADLDLADAMARDALDLYEAAGQGADAAGVARMLERLARRRARAGGPRGAEDARDLRVVRARFAPPSCAAPLRAGGRGGRSMRMGCVCDVHRLCITRAGPYLGTTGGPSMTQRLHLVFGGELVDPQRNVFKDPSAIHMVGMFPDYASAYSAWKSEAQRTVDNAHMRYFIAHIHRLRDEEEAASPTEELGR